MKPHLVRYWLTPVVDEQLDEKVSDINQLYQQAPRLVEQGEAVVSTDELTGVQALERKHETLPMKAGIVEYQEFEYKRHGTQSFIVNFMVATGEIGTVSHGSTRNETNFLNHVRAAVQAHPEIDKTQWRIPHTKSYALEALSESHKEAYLSYEPMPYRGRVVIFRASKQPPGIYPDRTLGWGQLINGETEIFEIPAYHQTILEEPQVQDVAEKLKPCLVDIQSVSE